MFLKALPFILTTALFFGSSLVSSRFALGQFHPVEYVALRLLTAAIAFLLIFAVSKSQSFPRERAVWRHGAVLGFTSAAIPMFALMFALTFLSSGVTSLINTASPALIVVFAHFVLQNERLTVGKIIGVTLALGGTILLAVRGESGLAGSAEPIGYILAFVALISVSFSTIYARKFASNLDPFQLTSVQIFTAASFAFPLTLIFRGFDFSAVENSGIFALFYSSIIGIVGAFSLYYYIVRRFGATTATMVSYIVPVITSVFGALLLDEIITVWVLVAMALIFFGIWLINRRS